MGEEGEGGGVNESSFKNSKAFCVIISAHALSQSLESPDRETRGQMLHSQTILMLHFVDPDLKEQRGLMPTSLCLCRFVQMKGHSPAVALGLK